MSNYRSRGYSPPEQHRDSYSSGPANVYVTGFNQAVRVGQPSYTRGSVSSTSSGGRNSVVYQAQPSRKSIIDGKVTTEYKVRPKVDQSIPERSSRIPAGSHSPPSRNQMLVLSPRQTASSSLRDDPGRFLQPTTSHIHSQNGHYRHNSTSTSTKEPSSSSRDYPYDRRDKVYHSRQVPQTSKAYHSSHSSSRDEDQWSYTGPREQFHRDYPQRPSGRRETSPRKDRPVSRYESDRYDGGRDLVLLPSSTRQNSGRERGTRERPQETAFDSEPERNSQPPKRRSSIRQPVLHQQPTREDGYSSARDDLDSRSHHRRRSSRYDDDYSSSGRARDIHRESGHSRRDRSPDNEYERERGSRHEKKYERDADPGRRRRSEQDYNRSRDYDHDSRDYSGHDRSQENRRKQRSRDNSPDHSGLKTLAGGALGTVAAAGLVKSLDRDHKDKDRQSDDDDQQERRRRKHRHRSRRKDDDDQNGDGEEPRRNDDRTTSRRGNSSSESPDHESSQRRRSHRRRDNEDEPRTEKASSADEYDDRRALASRNRERADVPSDTERSSREIVTSHSRDSDPLDYRTMSPGEHEDDRPRRVQLVEPIPEKDEARPRGILKPARQVPFPEDPNPIREGVAPLKDASKGGIPPNARWTKISRVLVNPEALEKMQERFEERDEYMIVLRVLTKDEIKKLAEKTTEIRGAREEQWKRQYEQQQQRRNSDRSNGSPQRDTEAAQHQEAEGSQHQLAIEQGPGTSGLDSHEFQATIPRAPTESSRSPSPPSQPQDGPNNNLQTNYSQMV